MNQNVEINAKKEILKKIGDSNNNLLVRAKEDLKRIIDMGDTPEEVFQGYISYSFECKV